VQWSTPALARAARRLAVDGDHLATRHLRHRPCPTEQAGLKPFRRHARHDIGNTGMGGHTVAKGREAPQPVQLGVPEARDRLPAIGPADDRAHRRQHTIDPFVTLVTVAPGIFQGRKMFDDPGRHEKLPRSLLAIISQPTTKRRI
jgi:hypothetical protein